MSNFIDYKNIMAFHPGYYIAEVIEDMGITQAEFAKRLGTNGKIVSNLINAQINLSNEIAEKLSAMLGTSVEFWLNLQVAYEAKLIEIHKQKELDSQVKYAEMIDYHYFVNNAKIPSAKSIYDKIINLCKYLKIANLGILSQRDFLVNFRSGVSTIEEKNLVNAQAWLQTALNFSNDIETNPFNAEKLKAYLPEIRSMTVQEPDVFIDRLKEIFAECGVVFVLLPHLKNSGINGAVKWINANRVVLAMNDRRSYADTFWFSLFHEIKHVLQQKIKTVFVSNKSLGMTQLNENLEIEADNFAQSYLIPDKAYKEFSTTKNITESDIIWFSKKINIHPGLVVGRLQHDGIIPQSRYTNLKQQYKIFIN